MFRILISLCIVGASLANSDHQSGVSIPDGRIVGGVDVNVQQYPWQASVYVGETHICGASIISSKYAVTAAHCVVGKNAVDLRLRAGSIRGSTRDSDHQERSVQQIFIHPDYNSNTYEHNICIILVDVAFVFNDFVNSIERATTIPGLGSVVDVTGYGPTGLLTGILQKVTFLVIDNLTCTLSIPNITPDQFCGGSLVGGKAVSQEDSGGPVVYNNKLVGIVSRNVGDVFLPQVFTSLPFYKTWINRVTSGV